eukprot:scaffold952_cov409-Prasinococcus_capsulatus_cf.AAC.50
MSSHELSGDSRCSFSDIWERCGALNGSGGSSLTLRHTNKDSRPQAPLHVQECTSNSGLRAGAVAGFDSSTGLVVSEGGGAATGPYPPLRPVSGLEEPPGRHHTSAASGDTRREGSRHK